MVGQDSFHSPLGLSLAGFAAVSGTGKGEGIISPGPPWHAHPKMTPLRMLWPSSLQHGALEQLCGYLGP